MTPHILVIEDDPNCCRAIQDYFRAHGFIVVAARDGAWALEVAELDQPDVILLDLGLPGMHGYEVLQELQLRECKAPVIVITGTADPDVDLLSHVMGAVRTLHKPVSPRGLVRIVESLFGL